MHEIPLSLTNCEIMYRLETLICELQKQTGLAHAWKGNSNKFIVNVCKVIRP